MLKDGKTYSVLRSFNQQEVDSFSKLTGDNNYLHSSNRSSYDMFDGPIVHGAFIMGEFSRILGTVFPGPGTIYQSQDLKYYAPLYIGDEASFSVKVLETPRPGRAIVETSCARDNSVICEGRAKIVYKYITQEDIVIGLAKLGVETGDTILVHSAFKSFGPVLGGPKAVIGALQAAVGETGTVIMPTFNFDFASGVPYNHVTTPSKMGALTEIVRMMPESSRVYHPMYGFAVLGKGKEEFGKINNVSSYGQDSVFAKLREVDGKILVLGLSYNDSMTFFHHIEETVGCDYRYMKSFTGDVVLADGTVEKQTCTMYVRDVDAGVKTMVDPMGERLESLGLVRKHNIGRCCAKLMKATCVFNATKDVPKNEPYLLRTIG